MNFDTDGPQLGGAVLPQVPDLRVGRRTICRKTHQTNGNDPRKRPADPTPNCRFRLPHRRFYRKNNTAELVYFLVANCRQFRLAAALETM
ncbi:MAG: hypothetical protein ABIL01_26460 [Pseudomonadota bacterium]